MITATEAATLAKDFDLEGSNNKQATEALTAIDGLIRPIAAKGERMLKWIIAGGPANYHPGVFRIIDKNLKDAGYKVTIAPSGVWEISW